MKKFFLFLRFWECWCEDPLHFGDDPECPKHGFFPALVRVGVFMTLAMITIVVIAYLRQ